jgi:phage tail-like protein
MQLTLGLDDVLAPVLATLDCLPAHLDPMTAPADLLRWLALWVGLPEPPRLPEDGLRRLVASAHLLHAWCGTVRGIQLAVGLVLGADAEVADSGGTTWSLQPRPALPGTDENWVAIRVPERALAEGDVAGLERLLKLVIPAHVPYRLVTAP